MAHLQQEFQTLGRIRRGRFVQDETPKGSMATGCIGAHGEEDREGEGRIEDACEVENGPGSAPAAVISEGGGIRHGTVE